MQVILLERIGQARPDGRRRHRQGRLRPQLPAAAEEGAARHRRQPQALRDASAPSSRPAISSCKKEAEAVAAKLNGKIFIAIRQAGDTGQLYGSVSTRDIAEIVTAGGFTIHRTRSALDKPIKTLGVHASAVALHPEVIVKVKVNVARSEEEAARQARGEDVTVVKDEKIELETYDPDAVFEEGASPAEGEDDKG